MTTANDWLHPDATRPEHPARLAAAAALFGAAYLALALFAAELPVQSRFPLFIWPADGLALGVLLVAPRRRWALYTGIAFAVSLAVVLRAGMSWNHSLAAACLHVAEPALIALGLTRLSGERVNLGSLPGMAAFLIGMVPLVAAISLADVAGMSLIDSAGAWLRLEAPLREQWSVTFVSNFVGVIVIAPLVLAWSREGSREALAGARGQAPELAVLYAGLVVATHFVFGARPQAVPFIPQLAYISTPFLIWAALRFGQRAATLALAIFGLICYWHTAHGLGPFSGEGTAQWTWLLHMQGFLATSIVMTLFAAAMLAEREEASRSSEAWRRRHEAVIRASGNLLYELDPASGRLLWDGDTRQVLGVAPQEIGHVRQWMQRVHPDDRARLRGIRGRLMTGEIPSVAVEYRVMRGDGTYTTVGANGYAMDDPTQPRSGRRRVIGVVQDVSARIRAEAERQALAAQLRQAEKMEAVGQLAGGIAHDFNNILGAILGYGDLAQQRVQSDPQLKRYVDTIVNAGNRAKALVAQILAYSRAEGGVRSPVIVGPIAAEVCDLVRGSSPEAVQVRFTPDDENAMVLGDPTRLHQLLMNLASNAVQAMPEGGTLDISVSPRAFDSAVRTRLGEAPAGEYVVLEVTDTGTGIAPEVIDRIFEPFFTTKPAGRGTGLGLALVHSIVREHRGVIDVVSMPGQGTKFTVYLPRVVGEVQAPVEEEQLGRGQVVLAVDDEPQVLAALEEMLASLGYEPAGYNDSRAALEAFRADPARFEAVVSDEVMPQLTGTQLAVELRRVKPAIPIVIASGYGGAGFETRALAAGVNRVLKKPYRMQEISEVLRGLFGPR
jgi:PAS domain S-box-containing protein